jgi:hypothetical protein
MEFKSNVSDISDRSISNFTQLSDEGNSQIYDINSSHINGEELSSNEHIKRHLDKIEFWEKYTSLLRAKRFNEAFHLIYKLQNKIENSPEIRAFQQNEPDSKLIESFNPKGVKQATWIKAYYKGIINCCLAQCLYYSDGTILYKSNRRQHLNRREEPRTGIYE